MTKRAIADLVHSYADGVVRRDAEQWRANWAPNATWQLFPGMEATGPDDIVAMWNGAMDTFSAVIQHVLNGAVDLDEAAGTGTGRWYVSEHWKRLDGTVGIMHAYYDDQYVRHDDKWLFARRELTVQYMGPPDLSGDFLNAWA